MATNGVDEKTLKRLFSIQELARRGETIGERRNAARLLKTLLAKYHLTAADLKESIGESENKVVTKKVKVDFADKPGANEVAVDNRSETSSTIYPNNNKTRNLRFKSAGEPLPSQNSQFGESSFQIDFATDFDLSWSNFAGSVLLLLGAIFLVGFLIAQAGGGIGISAGAGAAAAPEAKTIAHVIESGLTRVMLLIISIISFGSGLKLILRSNCSRL